MNFATNRRILIADDDPGLRMALRAALEAEGFNVVTATDGRAAMYALLDDSFDLAILDLAMPQVGGLEVLRQLELLRDAAAIPPILILTAYGSITAAVESARHGAADFLHKPIAPDLLLSAVHRALGAPIDPPMADHSENYFG